MEVVKQWFYACGREYEWCGGWGSVFVSRESGLSVGDVRFICDRLYRVFMVTPRLFRSPVVSWSSVEKCSTELIDRIKKEIFG